MNPMCKETGEVGQSTPTMTLVDLMIAISAFPDVESQVFGGTFGDDRCDQIPARQLDDDLGVDRTDGNAFTVPFRSFLRCMVAVMPVARNLSESSSPDRAELTPSLGRRA